MKKRRFIKKSNRESEVNKKENENIEDEKEGKNKNTMSTPFSSGFNSIISSFNENEIRKSLEQIIPKRDHHLIDHIINDKKHYYPNNLTHERGIFRAVNNGDLLGVANGIGDVIYLPKNLIKTGVSDGFSIMSHNHRNGLIIPSEKDFISMISYKSHYSPIYTPDKTGLLVNTNSSMNQKNWKNISDKYNDFMKDKKNYIEELYPEKAKILRNKYEGKDLDKKLEDVLYRPYFTKNQESITKEINNMFKEKGFNLNLYIL